MINTEQVLLQNAVAGQVVAQEVVDKSGSVLVAAGAVLTERLIAQLQHRGIESLALQPRCSPEEQAARRQDIEQRLDKQFSRHGTDATMQHLRQVLTAYHGRAETTSGGSRG